jgi:hypothetical protein
MDRGLQPFEPVFIDKPVEQGGKIISVSGNISPEYRLAAEEAPMIRLV